MNELLGIVRMKGSVVCSSMVMMYDTVYDV